MAQQSNKFSFDNTGALITTGGGGGGASNVNIAEVNGNPPALSNPLPVELSDGANALGVAGNPIYVAQQPGAGDLIVAGTISGNAANVGINTVVYTEVSRESLDRKATKATVGRKVSVARVAHVASQECKACPAQKGRAVKAIPGQLASKESLASVVNEALLGRPAHRGLLGRRECPGRREMLASARSVLVDLLGRKDHKVSKDPRATLLLDRRGHQGREAKLEALDLKGLRQSFLGRKARKASRASKEM